MDNKKNKKELIEKFTTLENVGIGLGITFGILIIIVIIIVIAVIYSRSTNSGNIKNSYNSKSLTGILGFSS